jgi:DNA-binding MarR family transcriptional regulator
MGKGIHRAELEGGSRSAKVSQLRMELAQRILHEFGPPLAEIARQLGVSTSAISKIITRVHRNNST